jgi:drug/metabolite transporter (DMT)-like permease
MTPTSTARAYLGLYLASVAWAAAFIAGKVVVEHFQPLTAAGWRHLVAVLVLLPFAWRVRHVGDVRLVLLPLLLMALCGGALYQWTFMAALRHTSATNAALLIALNPVLTVALSPLVGERLTRRPLAGVLLALAGAVLIITRGDLSVLAQLLTSRRGELLALLAASLWATFNLASRRVVGHLPNSVANVICYGVGAAISLTLAVPQQPFAQLTSAPPAALAALLFTALGGSVIAGQLFLAGVHAVGVGRTAVFIYLIPVQTALLSVLLLGEPLLVSQIIGGAAVLTGVGVSTAQFRRRRLTRAAPLQPRPEPRVVSDG